MRKLWPGSSWKKRGSPEREVAKQPQPLGEVVVVGHDHAALAGGDDLVRVEAEAGHGSERAGLAAADGRAVRLGAVLDHGEAVPARRSRRAGPCRPGWPKRCTGMIAFVRGVIRSSTRSRSRFHVVALGVDRDRHDAVVERGERRRDVGRRARRGPRRRARGRAPAPRGEARSCRSSWRRRARVPTKAANSCSKAGRFSPNEPEISPARTAAATASASSSPMNGS